MNTEVNPQNQFVVSYNENDFYCNYIGNDIVNYVNVNDMNALCSTYLKNKCNSINKESLQNFTKFSNIKECYLANEICNNKNNYDTLKEIQLSHSVSGSRFDDINSFYKTEILKSVNLGVGIVLLIYIIYKNY